MTLITFQPGQAQDERGQAERLGMKPGQVMQEIGYDDDCDEQLRGAISKVDSGELVDEDYDDVVDVVLLWWQDGDGDLVDALIDALTPLARRGVHLAAHAEGGQVRPCRAERRRGRAVRLELAVRSGTALIQSDTVTTGPAASESAEVT